MQPSFSWLMKNQGLFLLGVSTGVSVNTQIEKSEKYYQKKSENTFRIIFCIFYNYNVFKCFTSDQYSITFLQMLP